VGEDTVTDSSVLIRKYGNRRLYRTDESRYVKLDELAALASDGIEFVVMDAKSGQDLTSIVLAQVILEKERSEEAGVYPPELLRQIIRMGSGELGNFAEQILPRLMNTHLESMQANQESLDAIARMPTASIDPGLIVKLSSLSSHIDQILTDIDQAGVEAGA